MKFILINRENNSQQEVTPECVSRVIGTYKTSKLMQEVRETGLTVTSQFDGIYKLEVKTDKQFLIEKLEAEVQVLQKRADELEKEIAEEKLRIAFRQSYRGGN